MCLWYQKLEISTFSGADRERIGSALYSEPLIGSDRSHELHHESSRERIGSGSEADQEGLISGSMKGLISGSVKGLISGSIKGLITGSIKELITGSIKGLISGSIKGLITGSIRERIGSGSGADPAKL